MTIAEQFIAELTQETATTRRLISRVPSQHLGWKPHQKSMTLGQLAYHLAMLPRGITTLISELVAEVPDVPLRADVPVDEIRMTLAESVAFAPERLSSWSDDDLLAMWRMTREGQTLLELPRAAMFRSVMLNHWYHHRGQLTVYLRLLDVALPPVFGPTADETPF